MLSMFGLRDQTLFFVIILRVILTYRQLSIVNILFRIDLMLKKLGELCLFHLTKNNVISLGILFYAFSHKGVSLISNIIVHIIKRIG